MYISTTKKPYPYVLMYDRESEVSTVWWIRPMDAVEFQTYTARWNKEDERLLSMDSRSKNKIEIDREQLQRLIAKIECVDEAHAETGEVMTNPTEIADVIAQLDWRSLQELIRASNDMSVLKASEKNYSGSLSNGAGRASEQKSPVSPARSDAPEATRSEVKAAASITPQVVRGAASGS